MPGATAFQAPKYGTNPSYTDLPHPSSCEIIDDLRGAGRIMADGSLTIDLVDTTIRHNISITWTNIDADAKAIVDTFLSTLAGGETEFFPPQPTTPGTENYDVTRDENLTPVNWVRIRVSDGSIRYSGTVLLREA